MVNHGERVTTTGHGRNREPAGIAADEIACNVS